MTAIPSLTAGSEPSAAQWQTLLPVGTVKTANENRISTSTMASDAVLRADYNTSATYRIHALIVHNSSSAADFKFQIADSGACSLIRLSVLAVVVGGTTPTLVEGTNGTVFTGEGAGADRSMWMTGLCITTGTPGALIVQWAQNTLTASTTSVQAGSFISLTQVA